jgi:hypothetical protein
MKILIYKKMRTAIPLILIFVFIMPVISYPQITVNSGTNFVNTGTIVLNDVGITNNGIFNSTGGTITFTGSANSPIGGTGTYTINNITVNKSVNTAGIVLNCDITLNGTLTLTTGDFDIYNKILTLGTSAVITGETNDNWIKSTATSGKGTISATRNLTGPVTGYTFGNIGISITTSSAPGNTTVTRKFDAITISSNTGISKSFIVLPANNSGLGATLVFNYFGNEITAGLNPLKMVLFQSTNNGSTFVQINSTNSWNSGTQAGTLTITGLSTFGTNNLWTSSDDEHPLPVTLESFTASVNKREVSLSWVTTEENNNEGFEVQRGKSIEKDAGWQNVGYVPGQGTKNTQTEYSFKESKLNSGKYYYRLKQIDYNGNFQYHNLNSEVNIGAPSRYDISQNYPNPFNPVTKIDFEIPENTKVNVVLYDILGREVKTLMNEEKKAGYYTIELNGNELSSGTYFYRINAGKFVKTLKMIVLK